MDLSRTADPSRKVPVSAGVEFAESSVLRASAEAVWAHASSLRGVNRELFPLARMTGPRGDLRFSAGAVPLGRRAFRGWILLLGVLPVDYDDVTFVDLPEGGGFTEQSVMLSQREWRHQRVIEVLPARVSGDGPGALRPPRGRAGAGVRGGVPDGLSPAPPQPAAALRRHGRIRVTHAGASGAPGRKLSLCVGGVAPKPDSFPPKLPMYRNLRTLLAAALLLLAAPGCLENDIIDNYPIMRVSGTVRGPTGVPVANATVDGTLLDTGCSSATPRVFSVQTGVDGAFDVGLSVGGGFQGCIRLQVTPPAGSGLAPFTREFDNLDLPVGSNNRVEFTVQLMFSAQ